MFETLQLRRIFWYFVKNVVFWLSCFCHLCEVFFLLLLPSFVLQQCKVLPTVIEMESRSWKAAFWTPTLFQQQMSHMLHSITGQASLHPSLPPFCLLCFFLSLIHCCFPPQCCPTLQSKFSVMCTVLYVTLLSLLICYFNSCGSAARGGCFTIRCCFWSPFKI